MPRERLEQIQLGHLKRLVGFAQKEVPFWRARAIGSHVESAADLRQALSALPITTRQDLQDHAAGLRAGALPPGHAAASERTSSGSTGMAVTVMSTNVMLGWQDALTLRAYVWAGFDFSRSIAILRRLKAGIGEYPEGVRTPRWDRALVFPFPTGPGFRLTTHRTSLEQQWEWLGRTGPSYLVTYPSIVRGLAQHALETGERPAPLKGILTLGEVVDSDLRDLAAKQLDAPIHDLYSSEEAGCMAIQCPSCRLFHVQGEAMILEILDEKDRPCRSGEMGRVIVTPLFNYATPLIRYDIGDFAEAGSHCACGRGLPVLNRINGRRRNLLKLPDGRLYWPSTGGHRLHRIVPIRQHQFRQIAPNVIEAWLVTDEPISPEQETQLRNIIASNIPVPFEIRILRVPEIPRGSGGKYEEFLSMIGPAPAG